MQKFNKFFTIVQNKTEHCENKKNANKDVCNKQKFPKSLQSSPSANTTKNAIPKPKNPT